MCVRMIAVSTHSNGWGEADGPPLIDPSLAEKDRDASFAKIKGLVKEFSGKVISEEIMGEKKLAYKINRSEKGTYALYNLKLE